MDNNTGEQELVEVVNIHLDDANYLKENLVNRIEKKLLEKTSGKADYPRFTLVPVIWSPWEVLKDIEAHHKSGNGIATNGVVEPMAYCAFSGPNDLPLVAACRHFSSLATKSGRCIMSIYK